MLTSGTTNIMGKEKIKLKCIGIYRDGGTKRYMEADAPMPKSILEAQELNDNAYYLDGAFGSPTRGKFYDKDPKNGGVELNKDDYEFDR